MASTAKPTRYNFHGAKCSGRNKKLQLTLALISISALGSGLAQAASSHMQTGKRYTTQPIGHAYFCQQFSYECSVVTKNTKAPALTRKRWDELLTINARVNNSIEPVTDQDLYGVEEHWTYPKNYGDCEDYVLLKQHMLMENGWPRSSLLITVVKQPNGDGHAVLTVRTSKGDFILDNLESRIERWNKTDYKFLKRQSKKNSGRWIKIKDPRQQVAGY